MNIWIVNEGEPLPMLTGNGRMMRGGTLADYFSNEKNNHVTWWFSTFLHYEKRFYINEDKDIDLKDNLLLKLLHVKNAYKKNISIDRILYCRNLANKFKGSIKKVNTPDLIYCSWPLIELSYVCVKFGKEHNIPVIIDIRDLWPDIFIQPLPKIIKPLGKIIINLVYLKKTKFVMQNATQIIGMMPTSLSFSLSYGRLSNENDKTIYLAYKRNEFNINVKNEASSWFLSLNLPKTKLTIVYSGSINNRIDNQNSIQLLADYIVKNDLDIKILLCGSGSYVEDLKKIIINNNKVYYLGFLCPSYLDVVLKNSSIGLLTYRNTSDFENSLPTKVGEYLSYGLPILTGLFGLSKELLEKNNAGIGYINDNDFIDKVTLLYNKTSELSKMSQNALNLYESTFNADKVYKQFTIDSEAFVKSYKKNISNLVLFSIDNQIFNTHF